MHTYSLIQITKVVFYTKTEQQKWKEMWDKKNKTGLHSPVSSLQRKLWSSVCWAIILFQQYSKSVKADSEAVCTKNKNNGTHILTLLLLCCEFQVKLATGNTVKGLCIFPFSKIQINVDHYFLLTSVVLKFSCSFGIHKQYQLSYLVPIP